MKLITRLGMAVFVSALLFMTGCAGMGAQAVRRPAPAFKAVAVSGGEGRDYFTLDEFKGRPLVLNIGAIWCPHCLNELPAFEAAYNKYKGDAAILMVFIKSERPAIDEVVKEKELPFMVGHDPESDIGRAYGVNGIPVTFFIDPEGNITDEHLGGLSKDRLSQKIEELIKRSSGTEQK
jgi:peroxiredoxin